MADSVVSFLLEHLSQLLQHEANLLCGVEDKIISLRNQLEIINIYLKTSSDGKKKKLEIEQKVLSQIRDVAHVAEDVINTFITNVAIYRRRNVYWVMLIGMFPEDSEIRVRQLLQQWIAEGFIQEIMWNLQTISSIVLDKMTTSLIEKGSFPKLRKLGLYISSDFNGDVPKVLLSLQQLNHLNKLEITFNLNDGTHSEWKINCKRKEVLQSLKHLRQVSILKIINACDLFACVVMFPPNITKLTLHYISCLNEDGVNAIGNLAKLQILILIGEDDWISSSGLKFDLNCVEDGCSQLQEFRMKDLAIKTGS